LSSAGYKSVFSEGTAFINTNGITIKLNPLTEIPAVRYILDFDALVNDADARNKTFLNIIKSKF